MPKDVQGETVAKNRTEGAGLSLSIQQVEKSPRRHEEETARAVKEEALVLQNGKWREWLAGS